MANEFDKNNKDQQGPQQKRDQGQGQGQTQNNPQDTGKKNPNTQEYPERKDREGSEDVEKRRAS